MEREWELYAICDTQLEAVEIVKEWVERGTGGPDERIKMVAVLDTWALYVTVLYA